MRSIACVFFCACMFVVLVTPLSAESVSFSVVFAKDVIHAPSSYALFAHVESPSFSLQVGRWTNPRGYNSVVGVEHLSRWGKAWFGVGPCYLWHDSALNGTHLNFSLSLGYPIAKRMRIITQHYSHGSLIGIRRGTPNGGWNFLGVQYFFR